jgi:hypothetical protein
MVVVVLTMRRKSVFLARVCADQSRLFPGDVLIFDQFQQNQLETTSLAMLSTLIKAIVRGGCILNRMARIDLLEPIHKKTPMNPKETQMQQGSVWFHCMFLLSNMIAEYRYWLYSAGK